MCSLKEIKVEKHKLQTGLVASWFTPCSRGGVAKQHDDVIFLHKIGINGYDKRIRDGALLALLLTLLSKPTIALKYFHILQNRPDPLVKVHKDTRDMTHRNGYDECGRAREQSCREPTALLLLQQRLLSQYLLMRLCGHTPGISDLWCERVSESFRNLPHEADER